MNEDIYFLKEWQQLYAERDQLRLDSVHFVSDAGSVEYSFGRRAIEIKGEKFPYEDIVTPYAFSGPLLMPKENTDICKKKLAEQFNCYFQQYCDDQNIIAEYVQFSPWLKDYEFFRDIYQLDFRTHIIAMDLRKGDLMRDELNGRRRRAVRNAMKQGVEVFFDDSGKMIDEFLRLYEYTVQKYHAIDYYRFNRNFIQKMFEQLPGKVSFAYAVYGGRCAAICMLLKQGKYIHYHLAGNDPEMSRTNASSLLIYSVASKAQQEGYELFILGGAEGTMMEFKKTFTRNCVFDYYAGKKIRNNIIYDMLVKKNGKEKTAFFPAYRDDGKVGFNTWV